jgi:multidrug efflux pump subunit AcrB/outer membrane protein TolC
MRTGPPWLRYPQVTVILTGMLFAWGIWALLTMPRREDPRITIRVGIIAAMYPGATSEQVEKQLTRVIEERLFRYAEVRKAKTYSTSRPGLMIVNVQLEDSVKDPDKFWSKLRHDMIETRLRDLPNGVMGPIVDSDFGDTVAILLAIRGEGYGYRELKEYAQRIEESLRTLRATSKIKRYGEQKEEILVSGSLERLSQYHLKLPLVIQALQAKNAIQFAGRIETDNTQPIIQANGLFETTEQIRRTMIDMSPAGQPVYLGDVADVERRYEDPDKVTRYAGERCIMISVEMQEGYNIVQYGEELSAKIDEVRRLLPPGIKLDLLANQPRVVDERITHFFREFGIAIASVILVTILLLPFRVALIAAIAIPITTAITFGVLNMVGIELHQVSISMLVVVLGMVVDDAIVIADNYVELLDRGLTREEAARRCAHELAIPVLTATLTIIASFLPVSFLSGSVGEFIFAGPISVAISLGVSFAVAMLFTPLLCLFFIRTGLRRAAQAPKKFSLLDLMQKSYDKVIAQAMQRKMLTGLVGVAAMVLGVVLIRSVPERFMPPAERDQFVMDVWLPEGARFEATNAVMKRIEKELAATREVRNYATFIGTSAPRFYYNVDPQQPAGNYGQFLVNTTSIDVTPDLVYRLRRRMAELCPEARVVVKELEQGEVISAPLEIRVVGDDIGQLKRIGASISKILRETPGSAYVHDDWREDQYSIGVVVNDEIANRIGLSNASIARQLAGGFEGATVSTFWEGDRAVDIVIRLAESRRRSFEDIRDAYLTSLLTGASVPLREVAQLKPEWQPSRIVRRNGVRTLTVRSFATQSALPSEVLKRARPAILALAESLPRGYRLEFGGEEENQKNTFAELVRAMTISLAAIFLVLLLQFRSVAETALVMLSIPLALVGAALGLHLTGNPFGFTAFVGLVGLCGVVVRNAIILIDYIDERRRAGDSLEAAALEAGSRRLRPIFLTTMAAAVGVTPMILSGSLLWSPMASVIAVGLLFSMFFTLVVVPVLYVLIEGRHAPPPNAVPLAALALLLLALPAAAQPRRLTLEEAQTLAQKQNPALKIARLRVEEAQHKRDGARSDYYPQVRNESAYMYFGKVQGFELPRGSLGVYPATGPIPGSPVFVPLSLNNTFLSQTVVGQPLTQFSKIRAGVGAAEADRRVFEEQARKASEEIAYAVTQVYYGLLIAQKQRAAAEVRVSAAEEQLSDAQKAVEAGNVLPVAALGRRAQLLEARQARLTSEMAISDLTQTMNDLTGLPLRTELELVQPAPPVVSWANATEAVQAAVAQSADLQEAQQMVEKARRGVSAAKSDYIPEITLMVQYIYQYGLPLLPTNMWAGGAKMSWQLVEAGKRKQALLERQTQLKQAEENVRRLRSRVEVDVEKTWRKIERSQQLVEVAIEALALRREAMRLSSDQVDAGISTRTVLQEARAAAASAETDLAQADAGWRLAYAELVKLVGR